MAVHVIISISVFLFQCRIFSFTFGLIASPRQDRIPQKDSERKQEKEVKERELHELPHTEIGKSGTKLHTQEQQVILPAYILTNLCTQYGTVPTQQTTDI